jgi:hypothetical protein
MAGNRVSAYVNTDKEEDNTLEDKIRKIDFVFFCIVQLTLLHLILSIGDMYNM